MGVVRVWEKKGDVMEGVYHGILGEEILGMSVCEQPQCAGFIGVDAT